MSGLAGGAVGPTKKVSGLPLTQQWSRRTKLPPLGESGGAPVLESLSAGEVAFLVEVVVDRAMLGAWPIWMYSICSPQSRTAPPPQMSGRLSRSRSRRAWPRTFLRTRPDGRRPVQRPPTLGAANDDWKPAHVSPFRPDCLRRRRASLRRNRFVRSGPASQRGADTRPRRGAGGRRGGGRHGAGHRTAPGRLPVPSQAAETMLLARQYRRAVPRQRDLLGRTFRSVGKPMPLRRRGQNSQGAGYFRAIARSAASRALMPIPRSCSRSPTLRSDSG